MDKYLTKTRKSHALITAKKEHLGWQFCSWNFGVDKNRNATPLIGLLGSGMLLMRTSTRPKQMRVYSLSSSLHYCSSKLLRATSK